MEKKRRKRGENSYLNDFHPNLAGEYIYSGTLYACALDEAAQQGVRRALRALAAVQLAAVAASGSIPAPGMQGSFYVILPFLGELIAAVSTAWAIFKLGSDWNAVREYVYERTVPALPRRALSSAILAFLGILCESVHLALAGHGGRLFYAVLYLVLKVLSILCALTIRRAMLRTNWAKVPKCDEQ